MGVGACEIKIGIESRLLEQEEPWAGERKRWKKDKSQRANTGGGLRLIARNTRIKSSESV